MNAKLPYQKKVPDLLSELGVDPEEGLSSEEARERLASHGPNKLATSASQSLLSIYINQFKSPLIYILIFAAAAMLFVGQKSDAVLIMGIVFINGVIGTFQEGRARNSLEKLKTLTKHKALVRRDGKELLCSSEELVVGDIVILHEGDVVEADSRVVKSEVLTTNEAILTGEAFPIEKTNAEIAKTNLVIGDQKNMVFAGTNVSSGYGEVVVVATGFGSELGKISKELLATSRVALPLEGKVKELSKLISLTVVVVAAFVFFVGLFRGIGLIEIFSVVVGLSVSIIPEGLPVVVTIVLAKGVWRMAKAKAIVRQMAAVEAMGGADILLVDKTGTITTGKMIIREVYFDDTKLGIGGEGYDPKGKVDGEENEKLRQLLEITYLSLRADVVAEKDLWTPIGDPTEAAIAVLCRKFGLDKEKLLTSYETVFTKPFNSKKRYIEAAFSAGKEEWQIYIGAADFLARDLNLNVLVSENKKIAQEGKRVVALVLFKEGKLFAYALVVMEEEIRVQVESAVAEAKKVGFRIVMMTGDFPATAQAIAAKVGIFSEGDSILSGEEVEKLSGEELKEKIEHVSVFARITPEHKLKIVEAFKAKKHLVAMTGDGVNDAPALQAASLGIGLGSGTQVAKDASDIVLVDNNFSTIVGAISEGRAIYLTLKKVILYLFSTSFGEVLVIAGAIILGLPLPLLAAQIIWLNFVTDGFLDVSLAQDPPEAGSLGKKLSAKSLVDQEMITRIVIMGATMMVSALPIFYYLVQEHSLTYARSFILLVMCIIQWFNVLNVRSSEKSIFQIPLTNNYFLLASFAIVFSLQLFALQTSLGNSLLHTQPLGLKEWLLAALASSPILIVEEFRKRIFTN
ncbi:MAG: cation-transporting P-type ATPase [bacterium]|nr:cation-transporting P-type ATPase [bacterium]